MVTYNKHKVMYDLSKFITEGGGGGGTSDHSKLENRSAANQHPISAISNLQETLAGKQPTGDYATNTRVNEVEGKIPSLIGYATESYVQGYHDNTKQDLITDLADIRAGAQLGSTALQSFTETDPIYTADKPNIALKSEIPSIPQNVSYFNNDSGYLVQASLDDYAKKIDIPDVSNFATKSEIPTVPTNLSAFNNDMGFIDSSYHDNTKQDVITDLDTIRSGAELGTTAIQQVKTINGESIIGTGNIEIQGGGGNVEVDNQTITKNDNNEIQAIALVDGDNALTASGIHTSLEQIRNEMATKSMVDGQWMSVSLRLTTSFPAKMNVTYDLSSILPNDNYNYEVIVSGYGATSASSGKYLAIYCYSNLIPYDICLFRCITRTSSTAFGGGSVTIPIGRDRKLTIKNSGDASSGTNLIDIRGYRRIGTNE